MEVQANDQVKVEYEGKLEDGTIFDSSEKHGKPLEFKAGTGQVIKGFDSAVIGMKKDEEKNITITPEEGYGPVRKELVTDIPKQKLPEGEVKEGMVLAVQSPDGQQFPATVVKVHEDKITIDMNPPLAGKTLNFKLKVTDIKREE
ncbi:MAG: FKBP-type peptidyl-prolyl cis-trans isomerase [Candidatus Woesearchaeota archaeon]